MTVIVTRFDRLENDVFEDVVLTVERVRPVHEEVVPPPLLLLLLLP